MSSAWKIEFFSSELSFHGQAWSIMSHFSERHFKKSVLSNSKEPKSIMNIIASQLSFVVRPAFFSNSLLKNAFLLLSRFNADFLFSRENSSCSFLKRLRFSFRTPSISLSFNHWHSIITLATLITHTFFYSYLRIMALYRILS